MNQVEAYDKSSPD